jgi:hypothetical protein
MKTQAEKRKMMLLMHKQYLVQKCEKSFFMNKKNLLTHLKDKENSFSKRNLIFT